MNNRVLFSLFSTFSVPLSNARSTSVGKYSCIVEFPEGIHKAVSFGGIFYLFRTWIDSQDCFWFHSFSRSEEHTSELQSRENLVCRLLLEKKNDRIKHHLRHKYLSKVLRD